MRSPVRHFSAFFLLSVLLALAAVQPAEAQNTFNLDSIGVTKGQAVGIFVGAGAIVAVAGVGIYFLARAPRVTGCLVSGNGGLDLQGSAPDQLFHLSGRTAGLAAGQRVKVVGKKTKEGPGQRTFVVKSVAKNYGPCVSPAKTASLSPAAIESHDSQPPAANSGEASANPVTSPAAPAPLP